MRRPSPKRSPTRRTRPIRPARRPPTTWCARLPSHLRPAGDDQQLFEQLRAWHFPEKLIPLCIVNILLGRSLPIYGDGRNIRDWLYVTDHCRGIELVLQKGAAGETYNIGGNNEWANIDIVNLLCALVDEAFAADAGAGRALPRCAARRRAPLPRAHHLRARSRWARPPLRDRRHQDQPRTGLRARRELRDRHPQDPRLGSSPTSRGGGRSWTAPTGTSARIPEAIAQRASLAALAAPASRGTYKYIPVTPRRIPAAQGPARQGRPAQPLG